MVWNWPSESMLIGPASLCNSSTQNRSTVRPSSGHRNPLTMMDTVWSPTAWVGSSSMYGSGVGVGRGVGSCRLATFKGNTTANEPNRLRRMVIPTRLIARFWRPLILILPSQLDYGGVRRLEPIQLLPGASRVCSTARQATCSGCRLHAASLRGRRSGSRGAQCRSAPNG